MKDPVEKRAYPDLSGSNLLERFLGSLEGRVIRGRPGRGNRAHSSSANEQFLGPLEGRVMRVLWEQGPSTVRDVWAVLNADRPLAYTTVMTILSRLTEKSMVERDGKARSYCYRAAQSPEEFLAGISSQRVDEVMSDFGELAIAQFVQHLKQVDPERLRLLLRALEEEPGGDA